MALAVAEEQLLESPPEGPVVYAIADLHGNLPVPPRGADVLLIAGDICPDFNPFGATRGEALQANWLDGPFRDWLESRENEGTQVVACWGNHDYVGEHPFLVPKLPWTLLQDSEIALDTPGGPVRVWGTPWVPNLQRWAFYASQGALEIRAELIPEGLDVLMTHGPPKGAGDFVPHNHRYAHKYGTPVQGENAGDPSLNEAIARARPAAVICGHIHEARGTYFVGDTPVYNVAAVDETYTLYYQRPFVRLFLA